MPDFTDSGDQRAKEIHRRVVYGSFTPRESDVEWLLEERARFKDDIAQYREIVRKFLVLAEYGFDMQFFKDHTSDPDFMSTSWIERYYGPDGMQDYVLSELRGSDA